MYADSKHHSRRKRCILKLKLILSCPIHVIHTCCCVYLVAGKSGCKSQTIFSPDQQTNRTTSKWSPQSSPLVPQSAWKLPTKCEYDAATQALMKPEEPGFTVPENPDIYPGFSSASPLPVDPCEWQSYSLEISKMSPATIQLLYDTGKDFVLSSEERTT